MPLPGDLGAVELNCNEIPHHQLSIVFRVSMSGPAVRRGSGPPRTVVTPLQPASVRSSSTGRPVPAPGSCPVLSVSPRSDVPGRIEAASGSICRP